MMADSSEETDTPIPIPKAHTISQKLSEADKAEILSKLNVVDTSNRPIFAEAVST